MTQTQQLYIDGAWTQAACGELFEDLTPATQTVFARVAAGAAQDVTQAIEAAHAARLSWRETPAAQRARFLLKAADLLEEKQPQWANTLIEESGSVFRKAMFEVGASAGVLREAAAQTSRVAGDILPSNVPGKLNMVLRQPVGVVGVISPWNVPLLLSLRGFAYAMAYGNTIVLKPSEETPVSGGTMIAQVFDEVGLPAGVLNVVPCPRKNVEEVGNVLITHPHVRRISFTGSTSTGRKLAELAGRHLKKIVLELGGKDPLIVLEDANLDYAVDAAAFGAFFHQGQVCMAVERILVQAPIAEAFAQKLAEKAKSLQIGDPHSPETIIGPIINQQQLDKIKTHTDDALADGASALCGAQHEGLFYHPTVLCNVAPTMKVFCEETFGPIAPVLPVQDVHEAIEIANNSNYGLSAGIITGDFGKGLEIAEQLESGMVHVNDSSIHDEPHLPFGGVKDSGLGRQGGMASIEEFTEQRLITVQRKPRHYPF